MASFLYFGAGIGVGIMYLFHWNNEQKEERLTKDNLPYTIGMVVLDIFAPIFLMLGVSIGSSANASLLGNFEIVATTLIALLIFKETVSKRLWIAILFITISSIILAMLLGFVAYGLSIFLYIRAQRDLGAAKTSAYYAVAPFIGTFLAFVINGEQLSVAYLVGLFFMIIGTLFVVADTLVKNHSHLHTHLITHTHDGSTHTHVIMHKHRHEHFGLSDIHRHHHHNLLMNEHIH